MDASFRAFRDCVYARKTVIATTVIGGLLVVQFWSWFVFLLWLIPHIFVALLGLVHGAGLTLCQGKEGFEGKKIILLYNLLEFQIVNQAFKSSLAVSYLHRFP